MTTPTAEEFRNVIADELEALAKRVREPTTYVNRTSVTGTTSLDRANTMIETATEAAFDVYGSNWSANIKITKEAP